MLTRRSLLFGLGLSTLFLTSACSRAGNALRGTSLPAAESSPHGSAFVGRFTIAAPGLETGSVSAASFNGTEMRGFVSDPLNPQATPDQLWAGKMKSIESEFGAAGAGRVLSSSRLDGARAVLYKYNAIDRSSPDMLVTFDVWKDLAGKPLELSATAGNGERATLEQQMRHLLPALTLPGGPVDGSVFVVPGAYLHLRPELGESVLGNVTLQGGTTLTVRSKVFTHKKDPVSVPELLERPAPPGYTRQVLARGSASAGPLAGVQAVVAVHSGQNDTDQYLASFDSPGVDGGDPLKPTLTLEMSSSPGKDPQARARFLDQWRAILQNFAVRTR